MSGLAFSVMGANMFIFMNSENSYSCICYGIVDAFYFQHIELKRQATT